MGQLKPEVKWTDDCGGKKDYDGPILSVSSRYYGSNSGISFSTVPIPEAKPSAVSSILLNHSSGLFDIELTEAQFKGETLKDVQRQVEEWVQAEFDKIVAHMATLYPGKIDQA